MLLGLVAVSVVAGASSDSGLNLKAHDVEVSLVEMGNVTVARMLGASGCPSNCAACDSPMYCN